MDHEIKFMAIKDSYPDDKLFIPRITLYQLTWNITFHLEKKTVLHQTGFCNGFQYSTIFSVDIYICLDFFFG